MDEHDGLQYAYTLNGHAPGFVDRAVGNQRRWHPSADIRHPHTKRRFALGALVALLAATPGWAGEPSPAAAPSPPPPIAVAGIPARSTAEASSLRATATLIERATSLDQIEAELTERETKIAQGLVNLRNELQSATSLDALDEIERQWREYDRPLGDWTDQLQDQTAALEQELRRLDTSVPLWERTMEKASDAGAPDEIVTLARDTFENARKARDDLGSFRDRSLGILGQIGLLRETVQAALTRIENELGTMFSGLGRREADPLWSHALREVSVQDLVSKVRRSLEQQVSASACRTSSTTSSPA